MLDELELRLALQLGFGLGKKKHVNSGQYILSGTPKQSYPANGVLSLVRA